MSEKRSLAADSGKKESAYKKEVIKQKKIQDQIKDEAQVFKKQFAERTLKLVTGGFSLVAALAWNEVIKEAVNVYVKPFLGEGSGLVSLLIYAILVTALVVFITYQLSKLSSEEKED